MKRRIHLKSEAIYLKKLTDTVGLEEAAKNVGITTWALRRHLNNRETSPSIEIAAKYTLEGSGIKPATAIISGDNDVLDLIKKTIEKTGGNYTLLK